MTEAVAPPTDPAATIAGPTGLSVSPGLGAWLRSHATSFAFSSYQSGQLFLVGTLPDGSISLNQQNFTRAMGLCWQEDRLYLGTHHQVWRLDNMLNLGEIGNEVFDRVLVPRNAQTTGDVDIHELGIDEGGHVIFVNTRYSCLATLDPVHSFRSLWKPPFISHLAAEDRCHLNGMAMAEGSVRYVTAAGQGDVAGDWREHRGDGGVLIDCVDNRIVADGLSMPHSPRIDADDSVVLLDSGRGRVVRIDPANGERGDIAFCPGFLRGLALHLGHALVTVSKPRNGTFTGLQLDDELRARNNAEPWCGVLVVNLASGNIVEWVRLEGDIIELFDVCVMPGIICPMAIGPNTPEIASTISFVG